VNCPQLDHPPLKSVSIHNDSLLSLLNFDIDLQLVNIVWYNLKKGVSKVQVMNIDYGFF